MKLRALTFSSLRVNLLGIVFIAIIPAFILLLYGATYYRNHEEMKARDEALNLTKFAAGNIEQLIEGSRQVLIGISKLPAVQNYDSDACRDFLTEFNKHLPMYKNISVAKPNGDIYCSAVPLERQINVADLPWFQRAIKSRSFSIGEYKIGRISRKPVIHAALPAIDKEGHLKAVIGISIDLNWFNDQLAKIKTPDKTSVIVIDRQGTVLAHYPHPERWQGKNAAEANIVKTMLIKEEGTVEVNDVEEVNRIFSFMPIKGTEKGIFIALGISTDVAFAEANQSLIRNLIWLIIIALIASVSAWVSGDIIIMRRMKALTKATNELSIGNLNARVNISNEKDEIGQLGQSFNKMAVALEQNITERKIAEDELEKMSLELGISLSEVFEALQKISSGDPSIKADETSEIELIAKLKHMVNLTAENIGEIVNLSHEFAIGLTEHFDVLHRVSKGDLNAKVSGSSQVELLEYLKKVTNKMIHSISREIAERKQAEEKLKQMSHQNELILESTGEGMLGLDLDGNHTFINPAAAEMLGYRVEELLGRNSHAIWHHTKADGSPYPEEECPIYATFKDGAVHNIRDDFFWKKDNTSFPVRYVSTPIIDNGRIVGAVLSFRDVTEIKKMEEQMMNSEKLSSIGRLSAGIAHEIGNPLTSVFSFVQILKEIEQDEFKKESLQTIYFHINRISETLKQLSGYSKMPMGEPRKCNVNDIIETSINLIQYDKRAKDIAIIKELSPSLPCLIVDGNQLSQVFVNLTLNALDAMPDGGALTVRSYLNSKGDFIFIDFQDTGTGIRKEDLFNIFDPFYTTKEKGTGLGLTVSYNIIKKMNGDITVKSEIGRGATFTVKIPLMDI